MIMNGSRFWHIAKCAIGYFLAFVALSFVSGICVNSLMIGIPEMSQGNPFRLRWDTVYMFDTYVYGVGTAFVFAFLYFIKVVDKRSQSTLMKVAAKGVETSLENARFLTDAERDKIFPKGTYLNPPKKDGVPVRAVVNSTGTNIDINVSPAVHSLIIGATGSGKTTTFINPMIQIIGQTGLGSSMIITDPKGELFALHSKRLLKDGYDVKVLDLRDTYNSYRWNPLDSMFSMYNDYIEAGKNILIHKDTIGKYPDLKIRFGTIDDFKDVECWYEYRGQAFAYKQECIDIVSVARQQIYDEMYEDLNDLVSVLCPVESEKDPVWEKGAKSIILATILAMLEDSENPDLGMVREKFNFFNVNKAISNSEGSYIVLKKYFQGRSAVSQAVGLSRQTMGAADNTLASYMSIALDKMSMFNDRGLCGLTSATDINPSDLALKPSALFLKIPDEKDTRHPLASVFVLCIYKALIKLASSRDDLTLPRNVYFVLDEFGNMPRIEKFDKMITVGRSRKIWFNMVIQSYAQLNNVYGDKVSEIIKSNCGIKMFIGTNDNETCKDFSELCGNMTVYTNSVSSSVGKEAGDLSYSSQVQTRPLIYPSELQKLNNAQDNGNAIVVSFGNHPLRTKLTPSYKFKGYRFGQMDTREAFSNAFHADRVYYDLYTRNKKVGVQE